MWESICSWISKLIRRQGKAKVTIPFPKSFGLLPVRYLTSLKQCGKHGNIDKEEEEEEEKSMFL